MPDNSFASCEPNSEIRVILAKGAPLTGRYMTQAGMHFIHCRNQGIPGIGSVSGPFFAEDVVAVIVLRTAEEVHEELYERTRGTPLPGREPTTAEDYHHRLMMIAKAISGERDFYRKRQLETQFADVADRIALAKSKRNWIMLEAAWSLRSNAPPSMKDLWGEPIASPSLLMRPQPEDYDPSPEVRRRRRMLPEYVRRDPRSITNTLSALRKAGLKARITRLGDPAFDRGVIQIDLPMRGRARFNAIAERDQSGRMTWGLKWEGNASRAGLKKLTAARRSTEFHTIQCALKRQDTFEATLDPAPPNQSSVNYTSP